MEELLRMSGERQGMFVVNFVTNFVVNSDQNKNLQNGYRASIDV